MTKRELLIVGVVLVLIAASVAVWMYEKPANKNAVEQVTQNEQANASSTSEASTTGACSAEQMQCADGTFVFRTAPDCRFVCPNVSATPVVAAGGSLTVRIGETGKSSAGSKVEITPMGVLEDSRCPTDVQCIQAGTVRLRANVLVASATSTVDFKLGEAVRVGGETITLSSVLPEKNTKKPTTYADYKFTFKVAQ